MEYVRYSTNIITVKSYPFTAEVIYNTAYLL